MKEGFVSTALGKAKRASLIPSLLLLFAVLASAADLADLATGQHSIKSLGPNYYVEVPMRDAEDGARVVLFNHRLASALGIDSSDSESLQKKLLHLFAKEVDPAHQNKFTAIATRYQDGKTKSAGDALGDGRAVWIGELSVPQPDGKTESVDVVLKGIGQTPLAWLNHKDIQHKDGLQSIDEAVHSFIHSEASIRNGIDSTADLAVIQLPKTRQEKGGRVTHAAITVRVGKQTRLAHLRYFADQPKKFKKIFEYIVRRDLHLPRNAPVGTKETMDFLKQFTRNLAQEAARYYDLHAVHGSPTQGNRTTGGGTIDLGTFRYLDAHHSDFPYLFNKLKLGGEYPQTFQLRDYIYDLIDYMDTAHYPLPMDAEQLNTQLVDDFFETINDTVTRLFLSRMGIPENRINDLPEHVKAQFTRAVHRLYQTEGKKVIQAGQDRIVPAAFDIRKVLSESLKVFLSDPIERNSQWKSVFSNHRAWSSINDDDHQRFKSYYIESVNEVVAALHPSASELSSWVENAKSIASNSRIEPGSRFYYGDEKFATSREVLDAISRGESLESINQKAELAIEKLVDNGLVPRNHSQKLSCIVNSILSRFKSQERLPSSPAK